MRYRICILNGILFLIMIYLFTIEEKAITVSTGKGMEMNAPELTKMIALTFDDGPHPIYTQQLLDGLKQREVKVTFFLLGCHCEAYPDLVRKIAEDGHLIGNHTYNHIQLMDDNHHLFLEELEKTNILIQELTGQIVEYVRPPFGIWNRKIESKCDLLPVFWSIDPLDWCSGNAQNVAYRIVSKARENAIILLHDEYESSVEAALMAIDLLQEEGYRFVTVEELLLIP